MWIKSNAAEDSHVNVDHVRHAAWVSGGDARLYFDSTHYVTVTFGTTEAECKAAIARLVGAVDPANYVV